MKQSKKEKLSFFKLLTRVLPLVAGACPADYTLSSFIAVLHGVSWGFITFATQLFYDAVADAVKIHAMTGRVLVMMLLFFGATVVTQALNGLHNFHGSMISIKIRGRLGKSLNEKASRLDPIVYESSAMLDDINKANEGLKNSTDLVNTFASIFLFYLPYFMFMGWYLFSLKPLLAFSLLLVFLPVMATQVVRSTIFTKLENKAAPLRREHEYYEKCICDREYFRETRLLGAFGYFAGLLRSTLKLLNEKVWRAERRTGLLELSMKLLTLLGYVGVQMLLVHELLSGGISAGAFVAVFTSVGMLFGIMEEIVCQRIGRFSQTLGTVRNFVSFFELPERHGRDSELTPLPGIELTNVHFRYPGVSEDALSNLTLSIRPGETVAVVGGNGAGKSTLVRLMTGLYLPSEGNVRLGGIDTRELSPAALRQNVSGVFQHYQRYRMTLLDNIQISGDEKEEATARIAAVKADLNTDDACFPDGLSTMLSREFDGVDLSGGQWQRVAIARGFYRPHGLIVLDEPTAAIDPVEETKVYRKFAEIAKEKTAVIVTHRLGSARIADRILVLDKGRLAEEGTHDELIVRGGVYAKMFEAQAKWYTRETEIHAAVSN